MKKFLSLTSLTESEKERSGKEMLQDLLKDHEKMIAELKKEVEIADAPAKVLQYPPVRQYATEDHTNQ